MENFLRILIMPDNIPITALFLAAIFFLWISLKKALRNDRLIKMGQAERILDEGDE